MPIVVPAEPGDIPALAVLLEEMDRFYGASEFPPFDERVAEIEANLFGGNTGIRVLLAREGGRVVGFASYSFLWPAVGVTRSLYLKELYVSESHRRRGIATLLMRSLAAAATEAGCSRLEWTTDSDNIDAQRFYEKLGFERLPSKIMYRSPLGESEDAP